MLYFILLCLLCLLPQGELYKAEKLAFSLRIEKTIDSLSLKKNSHLQELMVLNAINAKVRTTNAMQDYLEPKQNVPPLLQAAISHGQVSKSCQDPSHLLLGTKVLFTVRYANRQITALTFFCHYKNNNKNCRERQKSLILKC